MSDVIIALNRVNDAIFVSLVNTTLQITILIPLIALLIWVFRIKSATIRYSLWLFALFAIVALPILTPFIPKMELTGLRHQRAANHGLDETMSPGMEADSAGELPEAGVSVPSTSAAGATLSREMDASVINPVSIAYFIWCVGAVFMAFIVIRAYRKLGKLRLGSTDVNDSMTIEMLSLLKRKIGVRRSVSLRASPEIYTPMSIGFLSPVIVIPNSVINDSSSKQLEMILTHELAHIKRNDYLVNLLQNVLRIVFFFHPLFHLMNRNLARECEHICDDWVIHVTEHRTRYAECLVNMLDRMLHNQVNTSVTMAMAERKQDIPGRIDMIVDKTRKTVTKVSKKALVAMLVLGCLSLPVIGGIGLIRFAGARPASDRGRIVFHSGGGIICVMDADGSNMRHLTLGSLGSHGYQPCCSPDGSQIAFRRYTDDDSWNNIFIMNADGGNVRQLTESPSAEDQYPAWSSDGKQIAFTRNFWEQKGGEWVQKSWAIYVINADGSDLRRLGEEVQCRKVGENTSSGGRPAWSPDGSQIAYYDWPIDRSAVFVMDANGENRKMLHNWGGRVGIDWSPDGDKIVFASSQDSWQNWQSHDLFVIDTDGRGLERLTQPGPEWYRDPAWSPDGTKIVFSSNLDDEDNYEIYVMNADGSDIQRLTKTPAVGEFRPDWTASSYAVEPAGKLKSTWGKIKTLLRSR